MTETTQSRQALLAVMRGLHIKVHAGSEFNPKGCSNLSGHRSTAQSLPTAARRKCYFNYMAISVRDTNSETMTLAIHTNSSHSSSRLTTGFPNAVKEMLITEELKYKKMITFLSLNPLLILHRLGWIYFFVNLSLSKKNPHFFFFFSFSSVIHQKPDSR